MFDKAEIKRWRRIVSKELHRLRIPSDTPEFMSGRVLAGVLGFGTDVSVLAEVTGYEPSYVRTVLKRARKYRIIVGQTLRVAWGDEKTGGFAWALDAMVAGSETFSRPPDPKRSAALKARKMPATRAQRRPRTIVAPGAVFTPKVTNSNPLYGLSEWDKQR